MNSLNPSYELFKKFNQIREEREVDELVGAINRMGVSRFSGSSISSEIESDFAAFQNVKNLLNQGRVLDASREIFKMNYPDYRERAISELAKEFIKQGKFSLAEQAANQIQSLDCKDEVLSALARELILTKSYKEAERVILWINSNYEKEANIRALIESGCLEGAADILSKVSLGKPAMEYCFSTMVEKYADLKDLPNASVWAGKITEASYFGVKARETIEKLSEEKGISESVSQKRKDRGEFERSSKRQKKLSEADPEEFFAAYDSSPSIFEWQQFLGQGSSSSKSRRRERPLSTVGEVMAFSASKEKEEVSSVSEEKSKSKLSYTPAFFEDEL